MRNTRKARDLSRASHRYRSFSILPITTPFVSGYLVSLCPLFGYGSVSSSPNDLNSPSCGVRACPQFPSSSPLSSPFRDRPVGRSWRESEVPCAVAFCLCVLLILLAVFRLAVANEVSLFTGSASKPAVAIKSPDLVVGCVELEDTDDGSASRLSDRFTKSGEQVRTAAAVEVETGE